MARVYPLFGGYVGRPDVGRITKGETGTKQVRSSSESRQTSKMYRRGGIPAVSAGVIVNSTMFPVALAVLMNPTGTESAMGDRFTVSE